MNGLPQRTAYGFQKLSIVARMEPTGRREAPPVGTIRGPVTRNKVPGLRHRARIRAARWLHPGYNSTHQRNI
jgi:hypothetical protein